MHAVKRNISDIPDELIHAGSTHRKRLVWVDEHHTGDIATINYAWLEPGKQLTVHKHEDGEEFYFFLDGEAAMLVGDKWFPVKKGDFVTVPKNLNHSVNNTSGKNAVFLTIRTVETTV